MLTSSWLNIEKGGEFEHKLNFIIPNRGLSTRTQKHTDIHSVKMLRWESMTSSLCYILNLLHIFIPVCAVRSFLGDGGRLCPEITCCYHLDNVNMKIMRVIGSKTHL